MANIVLDSLGIFSSHCRLGKLLNLENSEQDPHGYLSVCISQLAAVTSVKISCSCAYFSSLKM